MTIHHPLPAQAVEPWLRGTLTDVAPVTRAVLHALELAHEDILRWCADLTDQQWNARPLGLAPVAFHVRHLSRAIDRLLTYAEGHQLNVTQIAMMKSEMDPGAAGADVIVEFATTLNVSAERIRAFTPADFDLFRGVGKKSLPTTVAGLLVHVADHTQRHVGQAIVTAKLAKSSG